MKLVSGTNDLKVMNPYLADQWDYRKNYPECPEEFTCNSHTSVWWLCPSGHSWLAAIRNRNNGEGCPYCFGIPPHIRKMI